MVSITPSPSKIKDVKYYAHAIYEDQVLDQNDELTLSDFLSTVNLNQVFIVKNADGTEVTATILLNVVTITGAVTDVECTVFAFGRRA